MPKEMRLNALDMNCTGFLGFGLWSHPRDTAARYNDLAYWVDYAKLLERGLFDAIFLADTIGVCDVYEGNRDAALRSGTLAPNGDPLMVVSAMAAVTTHLGFAVTSNVSYEPPYTFARRISTLDHLTRGRIGWNIVTGFMDSGAKAMGLQTLMSHDERYDLADEYMEVVYRLWQQSWADDAVLRSSEDCHYADPSRVRAVRHDGKYFKVDGIHLSEPSPQRTPLLFQAGGSPRGRAFASMHAEAVFLNGRSKAAMRETVTDIRERAVAYGRNADDLKFFAGATVIVGRTQAQAQARYEEYLRHVSLEGLLAQTSASLGVDLSRYPLDEPLRAQENDANRSIMEALTRKGEKVWTVREVMNDMALTGRNLLVVGTPEAVADELVSWMDDTGIDGFNVSRLVMPESLIDFIDLVVPVLQERGCYKRAYRPGTLREKLHNGGAQPLPTHPAMRTTGAEVA